MRNGKAVWNALRPARFRHLLTSAENERLFIERIYTAEALRSEIKLCTVTSHTFINIMTPNCTEATINWALQDRELTERQYGMVILYANKSPNIMKWLLSSNVAHHGITLTFQPLLEAIKCGMPFVTSWLLGMAKFPSIIGSCGGIVKAIARCPCNVTSKHAILCLQDMLVSFPPDVARRLIIDLLVAICSRAKKDKLPLIAWLIRRYKIVGHELSGNQFRMCATPNAPDVALWFIRQFGMWSVTTEHACAIGDIPLLKAVLSKEKASSEMVIGCLDSGRLGAAKYVADRCGLADKFRKAARLKKTLTAASDGPSADRDVVDTLTSLMARMINAACDDCTSEPKNITRTVSWLFRIAKPIIEISNIRTAFRLCYVQGCRDVSRWIAKRHKLDKCTILCPYMGEEGSCSPILYTEIKERGKLPYIQWLIEHFKITIDDIQNPYRCEFQCHDPNRNDNSEDSDEIDTSDDSDANDSKPKEDIKEVSIRRRLTYDYILYAYHYQHKALKWLISYFRLDTQRLLSVWRRPLINELCVNSSAVRIPWLMGVLGISMTDLGTISHKHAFKVFRKLLTEACCDRIHPSLDWFVANYLPAAAEWSAEDSQQLIGERANKLPLGAVRWLVAHLSDAQLLPAISRRLERVYNIQYFIGKSDAMWRHPGGEKHCIPTILNGAEWLATQCARFLRGTDEIPRRAMNEKE